MCKRHRSEPAGKFVTIYHKPLTMHEQARCSVGRRGGREVFMRDETPFRVTNFRYHANPSSDGVFFRRRCNDLTFQRFNPSTSAKR